MESLEHLYHNDTSDTATNRLHDFLVLPFDKLEKRVDRYLQSNQLGQFHSRNLFHFTFSIEDYRAFRFAL